MAMRHNDASDDRRNSGRIRGGLGTGETGAALHHGYLALVEYPANVSLVGYADPVSRKSVLRPQGQQIH